MCENVYVALLLTYIDKSHCFSSNNIYNTDLNFNKNMLNAFSN